MLAEDRRLDQVKVDRAGMTSLRLASGAREFAGLKAFFAEHRAPLCWLERHRRFLAAVRTRCDRFNPFPGTATGAAGRPRRCSTIAAAESRISMSCGKGCPGVP